MRSIRPVLVAVAAFLAPIVFPCAAHGQRIEREGRIVHVDTLQVGYDYVVSLPAGYDDDPDRTWPLILFLHGGNPPNAERMNRTLAAFNDPEAIVLVPICPVPEENWVYVNWHWRTLGNLVRDVSDAYRVDPRARSVIGFSMGGSGAWELPFHEPDLFAKVVVIAGVCHPWSLRHYPKIPVWVFVGADDDMRKEQQETVASAVRFGVDVVETVWTGADHGGIYRHARSYPPMLEWLVSTEDLRSSRDPAR